MKLVDLVSTTQELFIKLKKSGIDQIKISHHLHLGIENSAILGIYRVFHYNSNI